MYRVIFNPALEKMKVNDFDKRYDSLETAKAVVDAIADYTLMLHNTYLMPDYSNYGYIELWDGTDWIEIEVS